MRFFDKMRTTVIGDDGDTPRPEVRMSEGYARRKTAFQIDPLLHETLVVDPAASHTGRTNGEMDDASHLHKHRSVDRKGNPYWKPLVIIAIALATMMSQVPIETDARSGQPAQTAVSASTKADWRSMALDKLKSYGYRWTTPVGEDKAVRNWQTVNGLYVDGDVGPQTLGSLGLLKKNDARPLPVNPVPKAPAVVSSPDPAPAPAPPTPDPAPAGSVEEIIRDVWPDDVEDWAVKIATRESNLQPGVRNACCIGLFQIHWYAHQSWLSDYGANSPDDLYDPRINATVALALFQSSGVGPWLCHGKCKDIPL